jgi:glycine oxidase
MPVRGFERWHDQITGVRTPAGVMQAGRFCIAGGAWSGILASSLEIDVRIDPVRGQIVLLSHVPPLFSHVIQVGRRYLVPRDDGRTLIGSTEERAGFVKANTAAAVSDLISFGSRVVPALAGARFERAWSGLRPGSADGLPYLGRVADFANLYLAAGHFRSGLQMSTGTARLLRQSILDQETDISLECFSCERLLPAVRAKTPE